MISEFPFEPLAMAVASVPYHFSCSISTDKPKYAPSEDVQLTFDLTSHNEQDLYVLEWNTPLEGMYNRYLRVFVGGEEGAGGREVRYGGIMAKRGPPSAESYALVGAGKTLSASVTLNAGYDTSTLGRYSVELNAKLFDVVARKEGVEFQASGLGEMTHVPISCGPIHFTVETVQSDV